MQAIARPTVLSELDPSPSVTEPSDEALVARARGGDAAALEALTRRYRPRVYAYALGLLLRGEDAEDVAQETFVRVCRSLPDYRAQGYFAAWLFRITTNLCRDHARRHRRKPEESAAFETDRLPLSTEGPEREVATRLALVAVLERLSEADREILALHCLEGLSPQEIHEVLGGSRTAIRVRLWRARARLARELADWLD